MRILAVALPLISTCLANAGSLAIFNQRGDTLEMRHINEVSYASAAVTLQDKNVPIQNSPNIDVSSSDIKAFGLSNGEFGQIAASKFGQVVMIKMDDGTYRLNSVYQKNL